MLAAANTLVLLKGCICGVIVLLAIKSITIEEMFENLQEHVLLIIIGAFAIGTALDVTGVAYWIASGIVAVASSGGEE